MDGTVAGMLEDGEDGCTCASRSTVCAAPQSIRGRAASSPFLPRRTHICVTGKRVALLLLKCSSFGLTRQDDRSTCLSHADGCLSARKLCLSWGGKTQELLVACRSFWDTALLSCLCLLLKWATKTITLRVHGGVMTGVLEKQSGAIQNKWFWMHSRMLLQWSPRHPLQTQMR